MRRHVLALCLVLVMAVSFVGALPVHASALEITCEDGSTAQVSDNSSAKVIADACGDSCSGSGSFLGFPTWYKYLDIGPDAQTGDPCAVIGPDENGDGKIDMDKAIGFVALAVVEILLRVASIVALGFVMYGGFRYITSQGEPDATKSARQTIINSLIGLTISIIATGLVTFIANTLTS